MLLDTHLLVEVMLGGNRIGASTTAELHRSMVLMSTVSVWELAIKERLGKIELPRDWPDVLGNSGFQTLPLLAEHAARIGEVTGLTHEDPFDRVLLTQARVEGLPFYTADRAILAAGLQNVHDARV